MSTNNQSENMPVPKADREDVPVKTPLKAVKEQQAMAQENRDVARQPDPSPEVPGASIPSDRRHHPQRQMYGSGTGVDET
jgi:hypothetical protein